MPTIWNNIEKNGTIIGGYEYNEPNMTYNQTLDTETKSTVFYNGLGLPTIWNNQIK